MNLQDIAPQLDHLMFDQYKFNTFSDEAKKEILSHERTFEPSRDSNNYQQRRTRDQINIIVVKSTKDKFRKNRKLYSLEQLDFYIENTVSSKQDSFEDDDLPIWDEIPKELENEFKVNPVNYQKEKFVNQLSLSKF